MKKSFKKGKVYLVGAGPGDPGLITVRGVELLEEVDCIIYDKLANSALLRRANPNAEFIPVPKRAGKGSFTQEQISKLLLDKVNEGKTVVRLKGGDPCIFGRGADEAGVLANAGVEFEIVPGITAGAAACEYAGIMPTDRRYSSQVVFVTGTEAPGKKRSNIDWDLLAKLTGTIIFYMGMGNIGKITQRLISHGMNPDTAAAVVTNATVGQQKLVKGKVSQIAKLCSQAEVAAPGVIIIGSCAGANEKLNWFMARSLFGKKIVVTRDEQGNAIFAEKILRRGGWPVKFATIKLEPLTNSNEFIRAIAGIKEFDWIVFTSPNGVRFFFDYLKSNGADARVFGSSKIASIGSKTAERLLDFGIRADFTPKMFTSEELGRQLAAFTNIKGKKILLLRSRLAWHRLREILTEAGAVVEEAAVYTSLHEKSESKWLCDKIRDREIDWITFASPSAVENFFEQVDSNVLKNDSVKVACIGPVTSARLEKFGVTVDVQAGKHTIDGLLDAIEESYK